MSDPRAADSCTEAALEIVRPGLCTTYQDLGRPGHARLGIAPSGAMDPLAHRLASHLAGNDLGAAALELTGAGVELLFLRPLRFALAGADLGAELDGHPLPAITLALALAGARLRFTARRRGARASLALSGRLIVPPVFASAATDLAGKLGGLSGRPLRAGDRLTIAQPSADATWTRAQVAAALSPLAAVIDAAADRPLGYVPEADRGVSSAAHAAFTAQTFRLSPRSNRTGFRFDGDPLPVKADPDRLSEPTAPGAIQLPPDGLPILLMADRNTTGGYPCLGHLASVDRPRAAQLWPGDAVRFRSVTIDEARAALRAQEQALVAVFVTLPRR